VIAAIEKPKLALARLNPPGKANFTYKKTGQMTGFLHSLKSET
jgi:hypothetical protein